MSDLAATNCGCDCGCGCDSGCSTGCGCNNNCGCNNGCGNSLFGNGGNSCSCILWIICLMCAVETYNPVNSRVSNGKRRSNV